MAHRMTSKVNLRASLTLILDMRRATHFYQRGGLALEEIFVLKTRLEMEIVLTGGSLLAHTQVSGANNCC